MHRIQIPAGRFTKEEPDSLPEKPWVHNLVLGSQVI